MRKRNHDKIVKQYQAEIDRLRHLTEADRIDIADQVRRVIDPYGFCGCNVCKALRQRDLESFIWQGEANHD